MYRRLGMAIGFLALAGAAYADDTEALVKYYRKKNNLPPTAQITVSNVKESASIKGAKQGTLDIGGQKTGFVASPDMRYVVFGEVNDITVDPSKAVMAKIDLTGEPFKGGKDAKVVVVEYSDFQCPFCFKGYKTIEDDVIKTYGDKVKFYYKHYPLPFHPWAEPGSIIFECVKLQSPDAAWLVYKGYFENQKDITLENVKPKAIEYMGDKKIDQAKLDDCITNKKTLPKINKDKAEAASLGISGTPSFVINGRQLKGAQPPDRFKAVIDDELASAK